MKFHQNVLWGAGILLLLTGCIDDNYDLSDVDTTSEFKVKDLVIPVNLETVKLSDIIKVKENDKLKEVTIGGQTFYAVQQEGDFHSDGIKVNSFSADAKPMSDHTAVFSMLPDGMKIKKNAQGERLILSEPVEEKVSYETSGIDGSLRSLDAINFNDLDFSVTLDATNLPFALNGELSGVQMYIPKGLKVTRIMAGGIQYDLSAYNPSTGLLDFSRNISVKNSRTVIQVTANAIELASYNSPYEYDENTNSGTFSLNSVFNIESAELTLEDTGTMIEEIEFNVHYELGSLNAESIMGSIAYDLKGTGLNIEPIDLENIPDFLNDPQTDIMLTNPQIYLNLNNPVGDYGLSYQSKLNIAALRENETTSFMSPLIKVPGETGSFNFLLAPSPMSVDVIPSEYSYSIQRLEYPHLGDILSGEGLPKTLDVELVNPSIPEQMVSQPFQLGRTIDGMKGTYMFLAPLSLKEGSKIYKTIDGWWSEDLADLNIDYLTITADATNGLPTNVILNIYAIDKEGNQISTVGTLSLPEYATSDSVEITVEGFKNEQGKIVPFNNLDGIRLYVTAGSNEEDPLAPSQYITLDNLKAKVTGNYTRKL